MIKADEQSRMRELSQNTNPNSTESTASLVEAQSCFAEALACETTAINFLEVEKSDERGSSQEFFECLAPRAGQSISVPRTHSAPSSYPAPSLALSYSLVFRRSATNENRVIRKNFQTQRKG
jgi:hypothetical protein